MTRFVAKKIGAKLPVIALFQKLRRQVPGAGELLDVVAIPLKISLHLRQREVVSLKRVKSQMGPGSWEHGHEAMLVVLWRRGDRNGVGYSLCFRCRAVPFPAISIKRP